MLSGSLVCIPIESLHTMGALLEHDAQWRVTKDGADAL